MKLNINNDAVNCFFYQKYIGGKLTLFENCYKLRPSENLFFDLSRNKLSLSKYYHLEGEIFESSQRPLEERLQEIEGIITEAVEKRLIADVTVGSFLSGGVDSSLISAIISKKKKDFDTFSIGFKDESYGSKL